MDIKDLKDGIIYVSFTSRDDTKNAYLYILHDRNLYWVDEQYEIVAPKSQEFYDDYVNDLGNYDKWDDSLDSYNSIDEFLEDVGNSKKECVEGDCECDGDWSYLSENGEYVVTLFVGDEKVLEKIVS